MKGLRFALLSAVLALFALTSLASAQDKGFVGISMPTKSSARWIADGNAMVEYFQEQGYRTDLQYAEDDIPNQLAQIENMITKGVDALVIAAIDGTTLSDALQQAHDQGIRRPSPTTDSFGIRRTWIITPTFDNFQVGRVAGELYRRGPWA